MVASRTAGQVKAQPTAKQIDLGTPDLHYATRLIHQVCCLAGSFDLIERFADQDLAGEIDRHDTAALFYRLMFDFSFQGISDQVAANYMHQHGRPTWAAVQKNLARRPTCPKLKTYWHFYDCRYEKTKHTCAEPDHIAACPVPTHRLRNGHLNQLAYNLYLFIRDVADGDLIGWIEQPRCSFCTITQPADLACIQTMATPTIFIPKCDKLIGPCGFSPPQQLGQLGEIHGHPPRLVLGEPVGRRAALRFIVKIEVAERLSVHVLHDEGFGGAPHTSPTTW
jgi:hypothetical protein